MNIVLTHAATVAQNARWSYSNDATGGYQIEIPVTPQRTQVVHVTMAQDADGDAAAFIWSKAADAGAVNDPWRLLQLNSQLTYGRVALKDTEVLILHALLDATADYHEVHKALFYVAKAADDIEQQTYGAYTDVL
jgi:hypothetical protein